MDDHSWDFRGVFTIPSTPFSPDGGPDVDGFRAIVDFCVDCGAHGLVFPVNASEFTHLSDRERTALAEILVDQAAKRVPVMIGVAAVAKEVAAEFATHAAEIGADAVIAMPPYVRKEQLPEGEVFDYYRAISDAGQLPVCVQNYVPPIGTEMSPSFLLKLCREIEWVQYVKEETVPSTVRISQILQLNEGECLGVMGGSGGRYLIEEYRRGVCGNMPGCHVTDVLVALWDAMEADDKETAHRIYEAMAPLFFFEAQLPGTYKEVLRRRGVIRHAAKRNGPMNLDSIGSEYLDDVLERLSPFFSWTQ